MGSDNVTYAYELIDKFGPVLRRIMQDQKKFISQVKEVSTSLKPMRDRLNEAGKSAEKLGKTLSVKLTAPIAALGTAAVFSASKIEDMTVSFQGILGGSAEKASKLVAKLNDFTARTPFQLEQVATSARQLLASGVSDNDVTDSLQMLGDVAAAANIPLTDMASIFAKSKNKGKAMTEEMLQMAERGIPIIQTLSEMLKVSTNDVFQLASKGQISFGLVTKALKKMTSEGGFAYRAMILRSQTLSGVWSTFKDNFMLAAAEMGNQLLPKLKELAIRGIEVMQSFAAFAKVNPKMVKFLIVALGVVAAVGPLVIMLGQFAFFLSALLNPVSLVVVGILALSGALAALYLKWGDLVSAFKKTPLFHILLPVISLLIDQLKGLWMGFQMIGNITVQIFSKVVEVVNMAADAINRVKDSKLGKILSAVSGGAGIISPGGLVSAGSQLINGSINVNLNAPKGTVQSSSVKNKSKNVKIGLNMGGV